MPPGEPERTSEEAVKETAPKAVRRKNVPVKRGWGWKWFFPVFIVVPVILLLSRMGNTEVKIWPKTNTVFFDTALTVDSETSNVNTAEQIIPGQTFEATADFSQAFTSSAKTVKSAKGIIRLYNAYSTEPEEWLEGTRFISDEGKIFKSDGEISVPGAEEKNGKLIPKYVDVPVTAAEPGEDYNIGPSNFSIYVFRSTPRYTKFYGESLEPMKGGGEGLQVSEEDLAKAEEEARSRAEAKAVNILKEKVPDSFILLPDVINTEITATSSSVRPGDEVENFTFDTKAKAVTIAFSKTQLEDFINDFVLSQVPGEKLFYRESLNADYIPQVVDFEAGTIQLAVSFSGKIYPKVDISSIKKGLVGKSVSEAKMFLESQTDFTASEVSFRPFWVRKVPADLEKIKIDYPII